MPFKEPVFDFNELLLINEVTTEYEEKLKYLSTILTKAETDKALVAGLREKLKSIFRMRLNSVSVHSIPYADSNVSVSSIPVVAESLQPTLAEKMRATSEANVERIRLEQLNEEKNANEE